MMRVRGLVVTALAGILLLGEVMNPVRVSATEEDASGEVLEIIDISDEDDPDEEDASDEEGSNEDIASEEEKQQLQEAYETCGYKVLFVSGATGEGMEQLRELLEGKTTTVAGPSGVGKSTIINYLNPQASMETGAISEKIGRGKHTTRHSEIIALGHGTYIMDTPGFTTLDISEIQKEELGLYYPEFVKYEPSCRYAGCAHITEPECGVKEAVEEGKISKVRYGNYCRLYEDLKQVKRY